jgi:hypothetical protein
MTEHDELENRLRSAWEASLDDVTPPTGLVAAVRARARDRRRRRHLTVGAFGVVSAVTAICLASAMVPGGSGNLAATTSTPPDAAATTSVMADSTTAAAAPTPDSMLASAAAKVNQCLEEKGLKTMRAGLYRVLVKLPADQSLGVRADSTAWACFSALLSKSAATDQTAPGLPNVSLAYTNPAACGTWLVATFTRAVPMDPSRAVAMARAFEAKAASELKNAATANAAACAVTHSRQSSGPSQSTASRSN